MKFKEIGGVNYSSQNKKGCFPFISGCIIGSSVLLFFCIILLFVDIATDDDMEQYAQYTYEGITISRIDPINFVLFTDTGIVSDGIPARTVYNFYVDATYVGTIEVFGNDGILLLAIDKHSNEIFLIKQKDDVYFEQIGRIPHNVHINGNAIKSKFQEHQPFWYNTDSMECYILCAPAYRVLERNLNAKYFPNTQIKPNYIQEDRWNNRLYQLLYWLEPVPY